MKIPLLAKAENIFIGKYESESKLVMYIDKKRIEYSLTDLKIPHKIYIQNPNGKHVFKDIFSKKPTNINIATDFNLNRSNNVVQHCKEEGNKFYTSNYIDQLLIEYDDFFSKYPSSQNPDVLTFDIETYNRGNGSFPKPESEPITILSYKINDEPTQVINLYNSVDQDKLILLEFKKVFEKYDPDVVCGYNSSTFDLVYIIKRCEQYGIDPNFLSRENKKCFSIDNDTKEYKIKLYGRVNFDVYNKVLKDQVIEGVPNKKLKTIANFYGIKTFKFEDIYTKETSLDMLKDQRYIDHVKSDVDATYKLFQIYNEIAIAVCELMHIPYGNYVEGPSSFVPKIFTARNLFKEGYLTFETNLERYKRVAPDAIRKNKDKEDVISNQGAIILMEKFGYFPYTHSVDFKSMYPSCMRTFNLGPDTTKFLRLEPYEESYEPKIQIKQNGNQKWLECIVSDKNFKANVVFAVDLSKVGFLKREMNNFGLLRQEYKKLGKEAKEKGDDLEAKRWKAKDNAIKVIMNCFSGDTEVFTVNGIKNIKDCKIGDELYTVNLKTKEIEISKVIKTHHHISNNIYSLQSKGRDYLITGNHKFPIKENNEYKLKELEEFKNKNNIEIIIHNPIKGLKQSKFSLFDYVNDNEYVYFKPNKFSCHNFNITKNKNIFEKYSKQGKYYFIKKRNIKNPKEFENKYNGKIYLKSFNKSSLCKWEYNLNNILELLGWYISEGNNYYEKGDKKPLKGSYKGQRYTISISQKKYIKEIKNLLNKLNIKYSEYIDKSNVHHFSISNIYIYRMLIDLGGRNSHNKYINKRLFKLDFSHLKHLYKTLMLGDGNKDIIRYTTTSKQLSEDFGTLLLHLGKVFKITKEDNIYRIFSYKKNYNVNKENIIKHKWNNDVYCITVEKNHTILAGRNGKFNWTGQSEYGYLSMGYSTWGDLVSAVAITALARWCIMTAITRNRDHICMVHTDSIYADCKLDVKAENDNIAHMIKEKTTLDSVVQFEDNGENAAYFIAKGNYALKSLKDGKIILHGGKTKSSKPPLFYNKYVKKFVPLILNEKPKEEQIQVAKELYSMQNLKLEDYLQTVKVTKYSKEINRQENIGENETNVYSSDTAQIPMLMMRMYKLFDKVLIPNDSIEYYKVKYDYRLKPEDIDLNEFKKEIQQDNNTIYKILLNYYIDQNNDDELLRQINFLFADKKLLSSIKIDPNLISNEGYQAVYLKEKHGNLGIHTVTQLNRLIFDICFPNSIKNKFEFGGYILAQEISSIKQLDKEYYQDYIVRLLEMFKLDPYTLQQEGYDTSDWGYIKPPKTSRLKKEVEMVNEDKLKAIREKLKLNPKLAINTICS